MNYFFKAERPRIHGPRRLHASERTTAIPKRRSMKSDAPRARVALAASLCAVCFILTLSVLSMPADAPSYAAAATTPSATTTADTTTSASGTSAAPARVPVNEDYLKAGHTLFDEKCATCHKQTGEGVDGVFPPLAGNTNLADLALIVNTVRSGHHGTITVNGKTFDQNMPGIGADFTAEEIAQVATYVRNSWGNDFGGVMVAGVKNILNPPKGDPTSEKTPPVDEALLKKGEGLFNLHCAVCHKKSGKGVPATFPPLADNPHLSDAALIVNTVHSGHHGTIKINGKTFDQTMPAIGAGFDAEDLAAVATYIRNSWGNSFGGVSKADAEKILESKSSGE